MPEADIRRHTFSNGLVLLAEMMPGVQSAAFTFLLPAGAVAEPPDRLGAASMLAEWITRGAGDRDSRELLTALDNLGVNHGESAQTVHLGLSGATLARNLMPALDIYADIVRRPAFEAEEVEPIRELCRQSLQSLEDDPDSRVMVELRRRHFPDPWGRSSSGTLEGIDATSVDDLRRLFEEGVRPNGAILAVAGAIDWDALLNRIGTLFEDWKPRPEPALTPKPVGPKRDHILKPTEQTQIALAYPTVPITDPEYYAARAAVGILGGFSSARLFTEVREKRGLCYSVFAGYESVKGRAAVVCYAGTSADRAQETLDVTLGEIDRVSRDGVEAEELDTMRAGLKSALVMQQESSRSRSGALAADWYHLGRVRSLEEISAALDALTPDSVSAFAAAHAPADMTIITLGPKALVLPEDHGRPR